MDGENHGDAPAPGERDHPDRDGIAAVGEQYVRPIDHEKLLEEPQDGADLLRGLLAVPRGVLANKGDRHLLPAGIEDPRPILAADRRACLTGLAQVADHFLDADLRLQVQLAVQKAWHSKPHIVSPGAHPRWPRRRRWKSRGPNAAEANRILLCGGSRSEGESPWHGLVDLKARPIMSSASRP